ncbi:ABC transporter permease [Microbacterium aquimaris]|uniref:ABC transporter permease subunit n=1 Tax=Microbacterium aquimaris TaxID=459816 RepID=A0ABU5N6R7_9MICO|nr:ABC transporter permease subunit [Microbacterium aquimaris]MAP64487.1 glycine/betaine ABC transporter permease [Microbacterium sp.]MDZ8161799.1 ABC transporter permease subunit [Microbacterium aquimaris]MDZ8277067.1 ABC transporter permease subunit [Microbacterium aquimaris]
MNLFVDAIAWIFSGEPGAGLAPIGVAILEHLWFTFFSVAVAAAVAIPIGWLIGHTGKGREVAVTVSGAARAIPSFGLILLLVLVFGVLHKAEAAIASFVILAIPSVLAGAYAGLEAVDRRVIDAGRATGMTGWQILGKIEAPLGLPLLVAGLRAGTLQVVATVTIAAYIGLGGLGQYIITGIALRRIEMVLGGALLVAALALILDGMFALVQHAVVPRGIKVASGARAARRKRAAPAA